MVTTRALAERVGSGEAAREDYALRQAPLTWRYRSSALVFTLFGGATAGFFLAFPAELAGSFGVANVLVGMAYAIVVQTLLNYVFIRPGTRLGLNSDLLSRGLGLGFDGSAWTTLIYWFTWVAYFGTEGQILGGALTAQTGIPTWVSYLIVGLAFVPLVLYGVGFMARFQTWTLILYVAAMVALIVKLLTGPAATHLGSVFTAHLHSVGGLGLLGVLAAYNGLIGNATFGHVDIGRLAATKNSLAKGSRHGILAIALVPYSLFAYVVFGLLGLMFWSATNGQTDPGKYFVTILGVAGFLLIVLTQLRINLINAYSGSLSLANFFSRLKFTPGRSFWAVLMVIVGTAMMFANILNHLGSVLTFEGVFLAAWIGVIFADLIIIRGRWQLGPDHGRWIEYRRAMLPHWNWMGVIPLVAATAIGALLAFAGNAGLLGGTVTLDISSWVTFILAVILTTYTGWRARGRTYARRERIPWPGPELVTQCPLDGEIVTTSDMFPCPHHQQWICAKDCMGTRACGEKCTHMSTQELLQVARLPEQTDLIQQVNVALLDKTGHLPAGSGSATAATPGS